jgi:predicted Zn-ribbon and HTH transcriptional regulator
MIKLICKKCGWSWVSRVDNPKQCPGCKNIKWNEDNKKGGE